MLGKIARYAQPQYVKRAVAAFTAAQIALLLGIATIWILAITTDNKVALTWGLWRLVDVIPIFISLGVWLLVDNIVSDVKPAIIVYIVMALVVIADLASLIWFGILYRDCRQYQSCLDTDPDPSTCDSVDPLCLMGDFNDVSLYYLVLTCVLGFVNAVYGIIVGTQLLILTMEDYRSNAYSERVSTTTRPRGESIIKKCKYYQYALNFLLFGWAFIVVEVCILTDSSNVKYYFFVHVLQAWCIVQTMVAYNDRRINQISMAIDAVSLLASGLGGLLVSILYYEWNCNDPSESHKDFANTSGCELGVRGARYVIALHAFVVFVALIRLFLYARTIRNQTQLASRSPREVSDIYEVDRVKPAEANFGVWGTLTRRPLKLADGVFAIPITSHLTGHEIIIPV